MGTLESSGRSLWLQRRKEMQENEEFKVGGEVRENVKHVGFLTAMVFSIKQFTTKSRISHSQHKY